MEIEKKYLVDNINFDLNNYKKVEINQGYLSIGDPEERVRMKKTGDVVSFVRTIKSGSGLCREETETNISADEFNADWPKTEGKRIEKVRYKIPYEGLIIELDIYGGKNIGLMVAEVEFDSIEAANNFRAPAWFGSDVTSDSKYKNKNLAK